MLEIGKCSMATQICIACDSPGDRNCPACHGIGKVSGAEILGGFEALGHESSCSVCGGSGECLIYGGMGEIEVGGEG